MARFYDRVMQRSEAACLSAWRKELLSGIGGSVLDGGFTIETIHRDPMCSTLPLTRATIRGVAVRQSRSAAVSR